MSPTPKQIVRDWVDRWRTVAEESDRLKALELAAMTEDDAARIFNGLDCDLSLIWTSEERRAWSGLVEQQRIFARATGGAPKLRS
jgi:hypothetical protein